MTAPRIDRRRFLGGSALLGLSAVLGPAGIATLRRAAPPVEILPAPDVVTVVLTRRTPGGVPYLEAVARPVPPTS